MFKAKKITVFLPGDDKTQVFKNVKFQSNPEVGVLAVFPGEGKEALVFSGLSFCIEMDKTGAKESFDMAEKAHSVSREQMKQMFEREAGQRDRFSSSFG
ncbi:MAG: hypothetical protein VX686_03665 [Candidatus Thermoplasmatota archaeon]|nr:hypothetical protein [Candidatus Thermoplasmatota archaeon]MEE3207698.1 hypothetical protein [Candidatus Thermoplasmatota archaeon]